MGIPLIRSAVHLHRHRRSMVGEVSAGASYAGVIGPRGMQAHCRCLVNKHLAVGSKFVLRLTHKITERRIRGLQRTRPAFNETCQVRWHDDIRHFERTGLACSLPQILGIRIGQVDDASLVQRAGSFAWTEYDDFHEKRFLPKRSLPLGCRLKNCSTKGLA